MILICVRTPTRLFLLSFQVLLTVTMRNGAWRNRDGTRLGESGKKSAQRGARTHDIEIKSLTLYRLS